MRILCFSGQKSRPQYQCDRFGAWLCPFPSARRHPSYGDCLEVKREYYQNSCVLDCVTRYSPVSYTHLTLPTNREV